MSRVTALILAPDVRDHGFGPLLLHFQGRNQRVLGIDQNVSRGVFVAKSNCILHGEANLNAPDVSNHNG